MIIYQGVISLSRPKFYLFEHEAEPIEGGYRYFREGRAYKVMEKDCEMTKHNGNVSQWYFSADVEKVREWLEKKKAERIAQAEKTLKLLQEIKPEYITVD